MDKDDLALPKATVAKLIKECLPAEIKCAPEARDLIADCCLEFVQLLSSEANDVCSKEGKKLIAPEHLVTAIETLGFVDFLDDIKEVHVTFKKEMEARPKMTKRLEDSGKTNEQLLKEQQDLFARARTALSKSSQEIPVQQGQQSPVAGAPAPSAGAHPKAAPAKKPAEPSEEEMKRRQMELFAQARAKMTQQQPVAQQTPQMSPLLQVGATPQPPAPQQ